MGGPSKSEGVGGCREELCRSGGVEGAAEEILLVSLSATTSAISKCDTMLHSSSAVAYRATYRDKKSLSVFLTTKKYLIISSDLLQNYHIR